MIVVAMLLIVIGLAAGAAVLTESDQQPGPVDAQRALGPRAAGGQRGIQAELYRANQINLGAQKLTNGLSLATILSQLATCPVPQVNTSGAVIGLQFTAIACVGAACPSNSASGISNPGPNRGAGGQSRLLPDIVPSRSSPTSATSCS